MMAATRTLIADGHPLFREALKQALNHTACGFIPGTAGIDTIAGAANAPLRGGIPAPGGSARPTATSREAEDIPRRVATLTARQIRVLMPL